MKRWLITLFLAFFITSSAHAGSIKMGTAFGTYTVYVTNYIGEADLVVYRTDFIGQAQGHDEIWYIDPDFGKIKIKLTNYKGAEDLIVYFTPYPGQAGWKKENKLKGKLG